MVSVNVSAVSSKSDLFYVSASGPQTAALGAVNLRLAAYGPFPRVPGEIPIPLRLTLRRRSAPGRVVAVLDQCKDPKWQDTLSEPGAASVVFANDDLDLGLLDQACVILFELYGRACFTMLPRQLERTVISAGEESDALTTVSGPGNLARLEEAIVYPSRGLGVWPIEEDRLFSWPAPDYDDSWWGQPWALAKWSDPTVWTKDAKPGSAPAPDEWPDPDCEWIWAPGSTWMLAPGGPCYARANFWVPDDIKSVRVYFAFDAFGTCYIDGQEIGTNTWALDTWKASQDEIPITPGWHNVACLATNDYLGPDGGEQNPGGILVSIYASGPSGLVDPPLLRSNATDWRMLAYPETPPGMTPGEAIEHCVREAQHRGALGDLALAFNRYTDSGGNPWPVVGDIATKVGYDVLTFVRELAGTYIDVTMAPAAPFLYAWARGSLGETTTISLHGPTDRADPNSGNVGTIKHKRVL